MPVVITAKHKERIIEAIKKGETTTRIVKRYKEKYSTQQIAAIRAHVTMGTY